MKRIFLLLGTVLLALLCLAGCGADTDSDMRQLVLADDATTLDGAALTADGPVTASRDIVYYEAGKGADYGEGAAADEHTAEEAAAHTVITIRQAGRYRVSGQLTGQLAIDLGEDAKRDPAAVVELVLDGADIACTVAPAVIFYNVYECDTAWVAYDEGEAEEYSASPQVDTSGAGARVVLADGSQNNINGTYVARIYKPGTEKKLHKYDGAFYSRMTMTIDGDGKGTGVLNITAANEGLDSELHLTMNGGCVNITAQNDGINTNEDGISVTTVNGGSLFINAGLGQEGDGIDSNGHLVINGGTVTVYGSDHSMDGGIDADDSILLNGGTLAAFGTENSRIDTDSAQPWMELRFAAPLAAGSRVQLQGPDGETILDLTTEKAAQCLTLSDPALQENVEYTLLVNGTVQQYTGRSASGFGPGGMGGPGGGELQPLDGFAPGERPDNALPPEGFDPGTAPDDMTPPQGFEPGEMPTLPDGAQPPQGIGPDQLPEGTIPPEGFGGSRPGGEGQPQDAGEGTTAFVITAEGHSFAGVGDKV